MKRTPPPTQRLVDALSASTDGLDARLVDQAVAADQGAASVLTRLVPDSRRDSIAAIAGFLIMCEATCPTTPKSPDPAAEEEPGEDAPEESSGDDESCPGHLWRQALDAMCADPETPQAHPVLERIRPLVRNHRIRAEDFLEAAAHMHRVGCKRRFDSWHALASTMQATGAMQARLLMPLLSSPVTGPDSNRVAAIFGAYRLSVFLCQLNDEILAKRRIIIPEELFPDETFELRMIRSAQLGHGCDQEILRQSVAAVRSCVQHIWELFEFGRPVIERLPGLGAVATDAVGTRGQMILQIIERWNFESMLHQPTLGSLSQSLWKIRFSRQMSRAERKITSMSKAS